MTTPISQEPEQGGDVDKHRTLTASQLQSLCWNLGLPYPRAAFVPIFLHWIPVGRFPINVREHFQIIRTFPKEIDALSGCELPITDKSWLAEMLGSKLDVSMDVGFCCCFVLIWNSVFIPWPPPSIEAQFYLQIISPGRGGGILVGVLWVFIAFVHLNPNMMIDTKCSLCKILWRSQVQNHPSLKNKDEERWRRKEKVNPWNTFLLPPQFWPLLPTTVLKQTKQWRMKVLSVHFYI